MPRDAADAFDDFFKKGHVPRYRQRDDLSRFHPTVREQLRLIQDTWIFALNNAARDVPEHVNTKPFHFDFVDADEKNATAFCYEGYALIAITVPLIFQLSDICLILSKSAHVAAALRVPYVADDYNQFHVALFSAISAFIVAHEFTHHAYGHVSEDDWFTPFLHISSCSGGSLEQQTEELVADGYSMYHVLENFLVTIISNGPSPLLLLNSDNSALTQEQTLAMIVVAVAAYLFTLRECELSILTAYTLSHPPPLVRLEMVMTEAFLWARKFPTLAAFLQRNFNSLTSVSARAILGREKSAEVWDRQRPFLQSTAGESYTQALINGVNKFKASK
jgi:hypothetical protein